MARQVCYMKMVSPPTALLCNIFELRILIYSGLTHNTIAWLFPDNYTHWYNDLSTMMVGWGGLALQLVRRMPVKGWVRKAWKHYCRCLLGLIRLKALENLLQSPLKCSMPMFCLENVGVPSYLPLNNCILDHLIGAIFCRLAPSPPLV